MGPLDAFGHLLNFVGPALGVALIATALAKLSWRSELAAVSWRRLAGWATCAGVTVLAAGLVVLGRDGTMLTYAVLVLANALALWWVGFMRR